jgi:hypothetical protein
MVRRDVRLSDTTTAAPRYLRVRVDQALNLQRIEAEAVDAPRVSPMEHVRITPTRAPDSDDVNPAWLIDLGGPMPLRQMQMHLPPGERAVPMEVSWRQSSNEPWRFSAQHIAFNLMRDGRSLVSAAFDVYSPPARYWRIATVNTTGQNADTNLDLEVTVAWQAPQLVFSASNHQPFKLITGSGKPAATNLPLFTLIPDYRGGSEYQLPLASLTDPNAPQSEAAMWAHGMSPSAGPVQKSWLLWAMLAAAVGALGWLAYKLVRDMTAAGDSTPAGPQVSTEAGRGN